MGKEFRPGLRRSLRFQMDSGVRHVPVLYLKFGENSGDVAYDSSPEGNDGDLHGPTWVKGILGPALLFDGLDDYVNCGNIPAPTTSVTVMGWVKGVLAEQSVTENVYVVGKEVSFGLMATPTTANRWVLVLRFDAETKWFNTDLGTNHLDDSWHLLAVTYDAEKVRMYQDGVLIKTHDQTGAFEQSAAHVFIGAWNAVYGRFKGVIDEPRIYSRALTAREILELYYGIE